MKKRGQIEAGELVLVVVIVVIIIVMGLVFYSQFRAKDVKDTAKKFDSQQALRIAQEAAGMPEVTCGYVEEASTECLDEKRLEALENTNIPINTDEYNYYRGKFGTSWIYVERIYPEYKNWTIYDQKPTEIITAVPIKMPVYVYDPLLRMNGFGFLTVVSYP